MAKKAEINLYVFVFILGLPTRHVGIALRFIQVVLEMESQAGLDTESESRGKFLCIEKGQRRN
jgi:hypothetical protein